MKVDLGTKTVLDSCTGDNWLPIGPFGAHVEFLLSRAVKYATNTWLGIMFPSLKSG